MAAVRYITSLGDEPHHARPRFTRIFVRLLCLPHYVNVDSDVVRYFVAVV
jgi:hypothetical protein